MEISEVVGRVDYGGSLPVENVQALASNNLEEIPPRYLWPEMEYEEYCSIEENLHIPVIDLGKLIGNQFTSPEDELEKLHSACRDWGFFQLINHGVPEELIEQMKTDTEDFFKLPLEEKKAYAQLPNDIEGYGQTFVVSEDQKLNWGDMLLILPQPIPQRNLRFWPSIPTSFRATLDKYSTEVQRLTIRLLRLMERNLGLEPEKLTSMFEEGVQGIRMNYYPPCMQANKVMGLAPHSDATGLTLLIQVNDVHGLQIKKNEKWVPIEPIPKAFIVNIGDIIEIMSNGEYKSIEHRAVVNRRKERLSIAAFHSPNMRTMIGPVPDIVKENTANYKNINHEDYFRLVIASKPDGKTLLDHMKSEHCKIDE
ncbi:S-norcoclaurine synthase 1-like [Carya illinoinensis]|uniref:Fe2OG dioxygenase domain-containing protein n=1 Tax=Carya illinoinensis TaxID=32201 RepID=A0A8T1NX49_CARIL|nr:S-norcoclaurine synthase 1-like [Carya illinoinensis]KAG6636129.1 hypothetical protein CIPAW_11G089300 [Carya illinoinensis]